jgi:hypothetical protein
MAEQNNEPWKFNKFIYKVFANLNFQEACP